jgi:hypothetical protein
MADIKSQLKEHLEKAEDWGKMATPVAGVYVVKVPATKSRPSLLFLEINPLREGKPLKRKGLFIGSFENLLLFSEALADDKVVQLVRSLEEVNPKSKTPSMKELKMD